MFSEVNRTLKNDDVFYLSTSYNNILSKITDTAWWVSGHRHYSKKNIQYYANQCGFIIERYVIMGGFWTSSYLMNLYVSKWALPRKTIFRKLFAEKQNQEYFSEKGFISIFAKMQKNNGKDNKNY